MAFVDSYEDEVPLELVLAFRGVTLEMKIGIKDHLWRSIDYLEVSIVDFPPQPRVLRDIRRCQGNGSELVLSAFVNLPSQ